jgi:hypothetical protein
VSEAPDPAADIARAVYRAGMEDGDVPFDDLDEDERGGLIDWAQAHIAAHIAWLQQQGFRLLPPGATLRPKSEAEALAMLQASKDWFDAKKRKPGLVGSVAPKLILPPGSKLQ